MAKRSNRIDKGVKIKYILKNLDFAKKSLSKKSAAMYTENFIEKVRNEFNYSPNTINIDIERSWKEAFRLAIKGESK